MDRARAGARRARVWRGRHERRRHPDARRGVSDRELGFHAGVVISASHNPFEDNGIKVFSGAGEKFTDDLERSVESIVADTSWSVPEGEADAVPGESLVNRYVGHLETIVADAGRLRGIAYRARLCQRRDDACGAACVPRARLRRHDHRERAGRPQHQSRVRLPKVPETHQEMVPNWITSWPLLDDLKERACWRTR